MDDLQGALDLSIKRPERRHDVNEDTSDDRERDIYAKKDEMVLCVDGGFPLRNTHYQFAEDSSSNTDIKEEIYKKFPTSAESEDINITDYRKRHCRADLRRHTFDEDDKRRTDIRRRTSDADDSSSSAIIRTVNGISVRLQEEELWHSFRKLHTEMIINRGGRRMFPHIIVSVEGLEPGQLYSVAMEIIDADNRRYKYVNNKWLPMGIADPGSARHVYVHPDSPTTGAEWAKSYVSFAKVKLTNNKESKESILLHSMHKYRVMVTIKEESHGGRVTHFDFPETTFIAVTAYQNNAITQLKIQSNPFAKAFRDVTVEKKRSVSDTGKCENRPKNARVPDVFPHTGEINIPKRLIRDQQQLLSSQQPQFVMPPGWEYSCYGNTTSRYIPWLNFGHSYSLPTMMPLWFPNRRQCPAVPDLVYKSWHKVSEEHNSKSEETWHKASEEHNRSSEETWYKVSESDDKNSEELNISDNTTKDEASSDGSVLDV